MRNTLFYAYPILGWMMLGPLIVLGQETYFGHFSLNEGLSQSTVHAIVQDKTGFMWFGTEDGLDRYDGYRFSVYQYDPLDSLSLGSSVIYSLLEDRDGELWVGTFEGGLNRFNAETGTFTRYRHDPVDSTSLCDDTVYSIFEDRAGVLWVGTGNGLDRMDRATGTFRHFIHDSADPGSIPGAEVTALFQDEAGMLWVGTWGDGLSRFDEKTETFTNFSNDPANIYSLGNNRIMSLYEDRAGELWVGTEGGLDRLERTTDRFTHFRHDPRNPNSLSSNPIAYIYEDSSGALWIGTGVRWIGTGGAGLDRYDPQTGTFSNFRHDPTEPNSLAADDIISIYEDHSGLLWIGTNGGGLNTMNLRRKPFGWYRHDPSRTDDLSNDKVFALLEDGTGAVWVGSLGGGLDRMDPATGVFKHFRHRSSDPYSLSSNSVYAIRPDSSGHLWIGTEGGGLDRLDRATGRFTHFRHDPEDPHSLSSDAAVTLYVDHDGTLWVGTFDAGLNRYDSATSTFKRFQHDLSDPNSLGGDEIRAIYLDHLGFLWVSTSAGLSQLNPETGQFSTHRFDPTNPRSIGSNDVLAINEDAAGRIWVGTYGGGLNLFDRATRQFRRFTEREGLPNNSVYGVLEDDDGFLWASTNRGITRFDPDEVARSTGPIHFRNFDKDDGLQSNEFNSGSFAKGRRYLYFGGIHGFNRFDPHQIKDNPFVPPVVLTSIKIFNEPEKLGALTRTVHGITLAPDQNVFSFEFAALSFISTRKNRYAYMLEGFKNAWIPLGTKRDISFTNLDPGSYVFRVKASNNDGVWNETGLAVPITITPPFWLTWWFRSGMALFVALMILVLYQVRTRNIRDRNWQLEGMNQELESINAKLEDKNAELERFTYTVSHDLKSPLFTIQGFLGYLEQDSELGDGARVRKDVAHIRNGVNTMAQLLDELLQLSRVGHVANDPGPAALSDVANEALIQIEGAITERSVVVNVASDMPVVRADRRRLIEVYQNLVENAIKFMGDQPEPCVEIGVRNNGDEVVCYVHDNGIGIDPQYHKKVFGLFERLEVGIPGTGIGLAVVKRIVEIHGGRIWVESDGKGCGSTICFVLPMIGAT